MPVVFTPNFYPVRLCRAVEARGLTWRALADAADIRTSTLSDYKNGCATPSPQQLEKIAMALDFPEGFFLRQPAEESALVGPRLFRASSALTQRAANQAEARLSWMSESLVFAEKFLHTPRPEFLSAYGELDEPLSMSDQDIEALSVSVREKLGFGLGPISNLVRTLERAGIAILRYESLAKVRIDGLSQHSANGRPLIAVFARAEPSLVRENFSVSHELGHIVLHSKISSNRFDNLADSKVLEDQANRFASAFLLPEQTFLPEVVAPTLSIFIRLKKKWRVSISAMIRRCFDLGRISRADYSRLNMRLSQKRWRVREPLDDVFDIERPVLLEKVFETLDERESIPGWVAASELCLTPRDLASVSGLPSRFFANPAEGDDIILFERE